MNATIKKRIFFGLFVLILTLATLIRFHNVFSYNAWWADDGGAHIAYTETILNEGRLPSMIETYVAWHEPGYYLLLAGWVRLGQLVGIHGLDWWEGLNALLSLCFLVVIYLITICLTKNKWIGLANLFLFSVLFSSVKLAASVSNEMLAQLLILFLFYLFIRWDLLHTKRWGPLVLFSVIAGLALLVKLTAVILLFVVCIMWVWYAAWSRKGRSLFLVATMIVIVGAINMPWLYYKKQHFGEIASINSYEINAKQSIVGSSGWKYLFVLNTSSLRTIPYWNISQRSFLAILASDIVADHYNLLVNVDKMNDLPDNEKKVLDTGTLTNADYWSKNIIANQFGSILLAMLLLGGTGSVLSVLFLSKNKEENRPLLLFSLMVVMGGILALVYNVLRLPYLERGVLKIQFVYFILPILCALSFRWWYGAFRNKIIAYTIILLPILVYAIIIFPIIWVK